MRTVVRVLVVVACLAQMACQPAERAIPASSEAALRIVSLAPHLTELAFSAGAGERLVGVVEYSDFPREARSIARVGDAFNVDLERLVELAPDLVLSWQSGTPKTLIDRLTQMGFRVVSFQTLTLEDIPERLIELGALAGDEALARSRATEFRATLQALAGKANQGTPVRVFYQISLDPLYTVGGRHFISEVIELCGGRNVFAGMQDAAAAISHESVLEANPQLILSDQRRLAATRESWAPFSSLSAVQNQRVTGIDADLVTRPTLRLAQGAQAVCAAIEAARGSATTSAD